MRVTRGMDERKVQVSAPFRGQPVENVLGVWLLSDLESVLSGANIRQSGQRTVHSPYVTVIDRQRHNRHTLTCIAWAITHKHTGKYTCTHTHTCHSDKDTHTHKQPHTLYVVGLNKSFNTHLTSELLGRIVQVPCSWLYHTSVIHQPREKNNTKQII